MSAGAIGVVRGRGADTQSIVWQSETRNTGSNDDTTTKRLQELLRLNNIEEVTGTIGTENWLK